MYHCYFFVILGDRTSLRRLWLYSELSHLQTDTGWEVLQRKMQGGASIWPPPVQVNMMSTKVLFIFYSRNLASVRMGRTIIFWGSVMGREGVGVRQFSGAWKVLSHFKVVYNLDLVCNDLCANFFNIKNRTWIAKSTCSIFPHGSP